MIILNVTYNYILCVLCVCVRVCCAYCGVRREIVLCIEAYFQKSSSSTVSVFRMLYAAVTTMAI